MEELSFHRQSTLPKYNLDRNNLLHLLLVRMVLVNPTVLDALCFGLFGKPFRNINKGQLLNTVNGTSVQWLKVEFKIGTKS